MKKNIIQPNTSLLTFTTICSKIGVITDKCCQTLARWLEQTFNIFVPTKSQNQETMKAYIFYKHII